MRHLLLSLVLATLSVTTTYGDSLNVSLIGLNGISGWDFVPSQNNLLATFRPTGDQYDSIWVYSMSDPNEPELVATYNSLPKVQSAVISSNRIIQSYGAVDSNRPPVGDPVWYVYWKFDIYDSDSGSIMNRYHHREDWVSDIRPGYFIVADSLAFISGWDDHNFTAIFNTDNMQWYGDENWGPPPVGFVNFENRLGVLGRDDTLRFYDISNLERPRFLSNLPLEISSNYMMMNSTRLFILSNHRMDIYSIRDVNSPRFIRSVEIPEANLFPPNQMTGFAFVNDLFFLSTSGVDVGRYGELLVYRIANDNVELAGYHRNFSEYFLSKVSSDKLIARAGSHFAFVDFSALSVISEETKLLPDEIAVELFPNPFNSTLALKFGAGFKADTQLRIFDGSGRLQLERILAPNVNSTTWEASGVSAGTYFVHLNTANGSMVQPVVLVK